MHFFLAQIPHFPLFGFFILLSIIGDRNASLHEVSTSLPVRAITGLARFDTEVKP